MGACWRAPVLPSLQGLYHPLTHGRPITVGQRETRGQPGVNIGTAGPPAVGLKTTRTA